MKKSRFLGLFAAVGIAASCGMFAMTSCTKEKEPEPQPTAIEKPVVGTTEFVYSGEEITLSVPANDGYTVSGNTATAVGSYTATVVLKDKTNYCWADNSTADLSIGWRIVQAEVAKPEITAQTFAYDGTEKVINVPASELYTVSGNKGTAVGSYTVTVSLKDKANYVWAGGTAEDITVSWSIAKAEVAKPEISGQAFAYDGTEKVINVPASELYTVNGNTGTEIGSYTVTVSLKDKTNYVWADGTSEDITVSWSIVRAEVAKPEITAQTFTYDGTEKVINVPASELYTVSGNAATLAGSYTVTVSLKDKTNFAWADGTTEDISVAWSIAKAEVAKPEITAQTFTYDGTEKAIDVPASELYTVSGNAATLAGSYTVTVSLKDQANYAWAGGTSEDIAVSWSIAKAEIAKPTLDTNTYTYSGEEITVITATEQYTVSGNSATDAGTYRVVVSLADKINTVWQDGTTDDIRLNWTINKADFDASGLVFADTTVEYDGDAHTLKIEGLPDDVAVTYSNNTLTNVGTLTVTAVFTYSQNYNESTLTATLTVTKGTNAFTQSLQSSECYDEERDALVVVYDGSVQAFTALSKFGEVTVGYYTLSGEEYVSCESVTEAGEYFVRATVEGTANYTELDSGYVKLTVEKATYDMSGVTYITEFEFNGNEQTVVAENLPQGVTVSVSDTQRIVGSKTVTVSFTVEDEANYNAIPAIELTLTVKEKIVSISTYAQLQTELLKEDNFTANGRYIIYRLENDIDCENAVWQTVGTYSKAFTSNFDGNGYTIRKMRITEDSAAIDASADNLQFFAMFGALTDYASVHDVNFENFDIEITTKEHNGGGYYAFVCGRIPNMALRNVALYNISVSNSNIIVNDVMSNKFRMGGIIAWDFNGGTPEDDFTSSGLRQNLSLTNTNLIYIGEPNGNNTTNTTGTGYMGAIVGAIDGSCSSGFGRWYVYENCTVEGGVMIASVLTTSLPYMGGLFGCTVAATTNLKAVNCSSNINMYRYNGTNTNAVLSTAGEVTNYYDNGTVDLNGMIGSNKSEYIYMDNCNYAGEAKILGEVQFTNAPVVPANGSTTPTLSELPLAFTVQFKVNGEIVTSVSYTDFGEETQLTVTADILFGNVFIASLQQVVTLQENTAVIVIQTTDNAPIVDKTNYVESTVYAVDSTGNIGLNNVSAGVRYRGNYTLTLAKKGYRIKFDKKQYLFSDYKCKSWALLPNLTDKTLLRNYLAFSIGQNMDGLDWTSSVTMVELYLNKEYLGVYLLCDQTQVDENRVNVTESSEEADTGFLIEKDLNSANDPSMVEGRDYFTIPGDVYPGNDPATPIPYVLKSPEYPVRDDYATDTEYDHAVEVYMAQFNFIKNYFIEVYSAVQSGDYAKISELCDLNSFADYILVDQLMGNWEIDRFSSFFFHKDAGGKLVFGPLWDYDLSAGYVPSFANPEQGIFSSNVWFMPLINNAQFMALLGERLALHKDMILEQVNNLDDVAAEHRAAIERNNAVWPVDAYIYPMTDEMSALKTYDEQLDYLQNYVTKRCNYLYNLLCAS